jgi:hypothetical protein
MPIVSVPVQSSHAATAAHRSRRRHPGRANGIDAAAGVTAQRGIAKALNERGVRTSRGGTWHQSTVRSLLQRAGG